MAATELASPAVVPSAAPAARAGRLTTPRLLEVAVVLVLVWACFASGATQIPAETRIQVALAVLAAAAGVAWAAGSGVRVASSRTGLVGLAGLVGFAAWSGISLGWSIAPESTWLETNRALAYAVLVGLGIVLGASDRQAIVRVPALLLAGISIVALYAFGTKAVPGFHVGPLDLDDSGFIGRLRAPLGYWNAVALLCATGAPIAWRLASQAERRRRDRGAALAAALLLVCTIGLTYSRGGFVALGLGVVVLTVCGPARIRGLLLVGATAVAATPVLAAAYGLHGVAGNGVPLAQRSHDGRTLLAVFAVCLVGLLLGLFVLTVLERRVRWPAARTRSLFRAVAILASFAVLAGTVGLALSEQGLPRTVSDRVDDFTKPSKDAVLDPSRLVTANSGNRWTWWKEAAGAWSDRPLDGWGAGSFRALHLRYREDAIPVTEAHSTPMQFLSETGLVGAVLGLGGILALLVAGGVRVRSLEGPERDLAVAVLAAGVLWAFHGLYDWDWDFPAASYPALLLLGLSAGRPADTVRRGYADALVRAGGRRDGATGRRAGALALGSLALAAAVVSAVLPAWADGKASAAQAALDSTPTDAQLQAAAAQAERAARLDPLSLAPLQASAAIAARRGRRLDARRFDLEAVDRQPESADAWFALAQTSLSLADRDGFARAAVRALALDPEAPAKRQLAQLALATRAPAGLSATAGGTPLAPGSPGGATGASGIPLAPGSPGGASGATGATG